MNQRESYQRGYDAGKRAPKWISVDDRLPTVPDNRYAVTVIITTYDEQWAKACNTDGYTVTQAIFDKEKQEFLQYQCVCDDSQRLYPKEEYGDWWPLMDPVTHWQPLPDYPE